MVAAGILPAVEGGHLAARMGVRSSTAQDGMRVIRGQGGLFRRAGRPGSTARGTPAATMAFVHTYEAFAISTCRLDQRILRA